MKNSRIRNSRIILFMVLLAFMVSGTGIYAFAKITTNGVTVYKSDNTATFNPGGATYSRIISLKNSGNKNGTLLCTFDQLKNVSVTMSDNTTVTKQVYPIYRSTDNGESWNLISNVYDREYGLLELH